MRTIKLALGDDGIIGLVQALVDQGAVCPGPWVERAIGYLSTWSMTRYPAVEIALSDHVDMIATYRDADDRIGYTIAAIWNGDNYGFHS